MRSIRHAVAAGTVALAIGIVFPTMPAAAGTQLVVMARQQKDEDERKDRILIWSPVFTAIIGFAALWISVRNVNKQIASSNHNAEAQRWRDANEKEVDQLEEILKTFHIPYLVQSGANKNVAHDLKHRFNDPNYRLLTKLFDPTWLENLSPGDKALVDELCETGLELRKFIQERGGCVDSNLIDYLARASTHYRILALAREGKLGTNPEPFKRYVYPLQVDEAIAADRDRLLHRLALLRARPSENHGPIAPLLLPDNAKLDSWPTPPKAHSDL